ncbi:MAG: hypothetical protein QXG65_00175 [Thermoplasmata archaeon]
MVLWTNILVLIAVPPFVLEVYNRFRATPAGETLFAVTRAPIGLLLAAMWIRGTGPAGPVDPALPMATRRCLRARGLAFPRIFLASIPAVWVLPGYGACIGLGIVPARMGMRRYGAA